MSTSSHPYYPQALRDSQLPPLAPERKVSNSIVDTPNHIPSISTGSSKNTFNLSNITRQDTIPTDIESISKVSSFETANESHPLPKIPDTPVGTRSFSSPVLQHTSKSNESIKESINLNRKHDRQSKSVDLSHLYLLDRDDSAHFTLTNESLSDVSHSLIKQYLGENSSSSLLPRMKTIEMYRKNVKKSNDPKVLFQYAQYMLQTALAIDLSNNENDLIQMKKQFLKEAVHYLKKLSDKGYADAQYLLADAHSSGALGKVDNKEAFQLFQGAAKHGHVESAYRTAYCYEEGLGVSRDSRRAIDFLKFAASKTHPAAMYKLGIYSFYGRMGLNDNVNTKKTGIQWLTRASTNANELTNAAPYELAKIHQNGFLDIVIPDLKYAMELYVQSASLGHIKSAAILGKAYELGNSVIEPDSDLSIHYYTQAALGGDAESMLSLCAWYLVGNPPNLPKDQYEAFQWALRAANLNLSKAQFAIGNFYEKGIGCEINLMRSKEWYLKASQNGDLKADSKLKKLNSNNDGNNENSDTIKKTDEIQKKSKKSKKDKKDKDCIIA